MYDIENNDEVEQSEISQEIVNNNDNIFDQEKLLILYQSPGTIIFSSYTVICNNIFNIVNSNNELSIFVIGILLERKK